MGEKKKLQHTTLPADMGTVPIFSRNVSDWESSYIENYLVMRNPVIQQRCARNVIPLR